MCSRPMVLVWFVLGLGQVALLAGCDSDDELPYVDLEAPLYPPVAAPPPQQDVLRIGLAPIFSPVGGFEQYALLLEWLADKLGQSVVLVQRSTYFEINELVRSGELACALVCSGAYVLNGVGLEVLVVPVIDGAPLYRVACVVQQDSPANRLYELGGAVFAVTDPLSFSGRAFMQRRLRDLGTSPEEFFGSTVQVEGHDVALQLVANGTVDGACVNQMVLDDMVRDNPALAAQLRLIELSDAYGAPPVVVNQDIEPQLKLRLAETFIQMAADTGGRVVLDGLGIDGFEVPPAGLYDDLERFLSRNVTEERPR